MVRMLQVMFVACCAALVCIGIVAGLLFAGSEPSGSPTLPTAAGIVALWGVIAILGSARTRRTLPCGTPIELATAYRTRFLLRTAAAETIALVAFALCFATSSAWPYVAALPYVAIGLWIAAPTRRAIAAEEQRLAESACGTSLVAALAATPQRPSQP